MYRPLHLPKKRKRDGGSGSASEVAILVILSIFQSPAVFPRVALDFLLYYLSHESVVVMSGVAFYLLSTSLCSLLELVLYFLSGTLFLRASRITIGIPIC